MINDTEPNSMKLIWLMDVLAENKIMKLIKEKTRYKELLEANL